MQHLFQNKQFVKNVNKHDINLKFTEQFSVDMHAFCSGLWDRWAKMRQNPMKIYAMW